MLKGCTSSLLALVPALTPCTGCFNTL